MTKKRILAIIIALLTLTFILTGCIALTKNNNQNSETSSKSIVNSDIFKTITTEYIGSYQQTIIYDTETMVEYAYLWHRGSGYTVSTMLYMADGTPKLYSDRNSKLIFISTQRTGSYIQTLMYDSETLVMYTASWHRGSGDITIEPLYNSDGNMRTFNKIS